MSRLRDEVFTVISTMKNEGPFILEWIAHHKALGFDHIVVCTNDCEDTTTDLLQALARRGLAAQRSTRVWPRAGIHRSALKQARRNPEVSGADWIFICDADEFLNVKVGNGTVRCLVDASGADADVISVPWRVFGPAGVRDFIDQPVTRQFTLAEYPRPKNPEAGKFAKSLFTGQQRFKRFGLHQPIAHQQHNHEILTVKPGGEPLVRQGHPTGAEPSFEVAQVNHYALRSADAFLVKRARGRANHMSHVLGFDYWQRFNLGHIEDSSIRRYDPAVAEWLAELHADAELHDLHMQAVEWYWQKVAELRSDPELQPLIMAIEATFPEMQKPCRKVTA